MTRKGWILMATLAMVGLLATLGPSSAAADGRIGVSVGASYGHPGYHHYPRYRHPYSRSWYPYWYWGLSVGYPAYPWGVWDPGYPVVVRDARLGAVDVNVKPKKAEVYIDGEYVGTAKQLDGYPSYLWLPAGRYELALYLDGYRSEAREISVRSGVVVDLRVQLAEGIAGSRPEPAPAAVAAPPPARRSPERRADDRTERPAPASPPGARDLRSEPIRLRLDVEPGDASVYLDGRLLGSAEELQGLHAGLLVEAGSHSLEVVRPGYDAEGMEFEAEPGEEIELVVDLEETTPR